jgi:hypothetical protein
MGKLMAEQKEREYNRGQKAASEGRSRSWSEPWAYPFESDQHYEERREAFNQGYGIIDATPPTIGTKAPVTERPVELPPGWKGLVSCSQQSNIVRKRPNTQNC